MGRGVPRDVRRARLIFSQLAKIGASETALFYLSDIYLTGKGVPRNVPLGMTYLQRAAQAGNASSAYHMGLIYRQGLYGHAADPQPYLYWIEKADRKSVVSGTRVAVRLEPGGRRILKKKKKKN